MSKKRQHRRLPLPEWFTPAVRGVCRWCGLLIWTEDGEKINKRRTWHKECVGFYNRVSSTKILRGELFKIDRGHCRQCGEFDREWQADHIVRLADSPRNPKYWSLMNLQTLCKDCHKEKTRSENLRDRLY